MRSGNALQVWVKTSPNVGNAKVNLTVNSLNGTTLNKTLQTAGNNLYSFDAVTFEGQNLNAGFTLSATVTLTFSGTIPYGSRLNFAVTAGNTTCTTQQQSQLGYIYSDQLDTPRLITNPQGQALWSWESDPFGVTNANENPSNLGNFNFNLRFPGQYYDKETKTHYNYFRDYDPQTGRYLQGDPIGLAGGLNLYGYVDANPVSAIDPRGLATISGTWMAPPRYALQNISISSWILVRPSWSWWGYLKIVRLNGTVNGNVNVDVKCRSQDACGTKEWEVHNRISIQATGSFDLGSNLYAIGSGILLGPYAGIAVNIGALGGSLLQAEHHFLKIAQQKAGPTIAGVLARGPTAICLASCR